MKERKTNGKKVGRRNRDVLTEKNYKETFDDFLKQRKTNKKKSRKTHWTVYEIEKDKRKENYKEKFNLLMKERKTNGKKSRKTKQRCTNGKKL